MVARVVGEHWHALVRDVMSLGYRSGDIFTKLTLADIVSIVLGAGPGSSIRHFLDGGWTREAHLLANQLEHQAGLATLREPMNRPGLDERPEAMNQNPNSFLRADVMTWEEMDRMNKQRYANTTTRGGSGGSKSRAIRAS